MTPHTWQTLRIRIIRRDTLRTWQRIGLYLLAILAWLWAFTRWSV